MSFQDDLVEPVAPVTVRAVNDNGGTFYVQIKMSREEGGKFLREMWESVDGSCFPQDDRDACGEWTDRGRDVRSTYSRHAGVFIRTHAWTPHGDRQTLHEDVLAFLRGRGLSV